MTYTKSKIVSKLRGAAKAAASYSKEVVAQDQNTGLLGLVDDGVVGVLGKLVANSVAGQQVASAVPQTIVDASTALTVAVKARALPQSHSSVAEAIKSLTDTVVIANAAKPEAVSAVGNFVVNHFAAVVNVAICLNQENESKYSDFAIFFFCLSVFFIYY